MCFEPKDAGLFWAMPPKVQDVKNANAAGVSYILMPLDIAWACRADLKHVAALGYRFVWRVEEERYYSNGNIQWVTSQLRQLFSTLPTIAAILGCEPENDYDLTRQSSNWGNKGTQAHPQGKLFEHRYWLQHLITTLRAEIPSLTLIAPGWSHKRVTESDPEEPGRDMWADTLKDVYRQLDGGALHIYEYSWDGIAGGNHIDPKRFKDTLDLELARLRKMGIESAWLEEANITKGTDVEQMQACIEMMRVLADPAQSYHKRMHWFSPFVSTGDPGPNEVWKRALLIQDEAAYSLLGSFTDDPAAYALLAA